VSNEESVADEPELVGNETAGSSPAARWHIESIA